MMDLQASSVQPTPQQPTPQPNNGQNQRQRAFITEVEESNSFGSNFSPAIIYALIVLLVVVVESFSIFALNATNKSKIDSINKRIERANTQLNTGSLKSTADQVAQINKGLGVYDQYSRSSVDYSQLWSDLQAYTAPNVKLLALSVDSKKVLKIDAQAGSYSDISKEIMALNSSDSISGVSLISTNSDSDTMSFSLVARYIPRIQTPVPAQTQIPTQTNQGGR